MKALEALSTLTFAAALLLSRPVKFFLLPPALAVYDASLLLAEAPATCEGLASLPLGGPKVSPLPCEGCLAVEVLDWEQGNPCGVVYWLSP